MGGLARYRVNANVAGLYQGELVAVDPDHPYWRGKIAKGVLRPEPDAELHMDEFDAPADDQAGADADPPE